MPGSIAEVGYRRLGGVDQWVMIRGDSVVLYGHSWDSALGVLYASRYPQKVTAYVGSGQIGDWSSAESASYSCALAEAHRRNNRKALKSLRAIGAPPYPASSVFRERTWLQCLDGQLKPRALWKFTRIAVGGTESSIFDLPNLMRGFRFSMDAMWTEVSSLDLLVAVPELKVPVFFFLGRRDHWVPPETTLAYFDVLRAPAKELLWFEESGHEPFMDEPAKFNHLIVDIVRPLATQ